MAQLIKLQNYVTRYEWDIYRYPSQFIRYKQDNWRKLLNLWNNPELLSTMSDIEEEQKKPSKWNLFQRKKGQDEVVEETKHDVILPNTEEELKHYFLNQLIPFQFKWATSTISNVSFVAPKYYKDDLLHYFLKRFPDTYLVMYYPVFEIRKAPVEGEIILISPLGIEIIYVLEENHNTMITASDDRSWVLENGVKSTKQLSPIFALKRTEKIVKGILDKYDISFPVHKVVLSRTNIINFLKEPYHTRIIGKHEYDHWFQEKRSLISPLKSVQLKAAEALLKHSQSSYVKRPEWVDEEEFDGGMMEDEG